MKLTIASHCPRGLAAFLGLAAFDLRHHSFRFPRVRKLRLAQHHSRHPGAAGRTSDHRVADEEFSRYHVGTFAVCFSV